MVYKKPVSKEFNDLCLLLQNFLFEKEPIEIKFKDTDDIMEPWSSDNEFLGLSIYFKFYWKAWRNHGRKMKKNLERI